MHLAERCRDRSFHTLSVVAPDNESLLVVRLIAGIAERRIIGIELVDDEPATNRIDLVANVEQHHMSVADFERVRGIVIMAGFFTALNVVMRVGVLSQHPRRVLVRCVVEIPTFENRYSGHSQIFNPRVVCEPTVGIGFLFVVMNMGIAGVPASIWKIGPSFQLDIDRRIGRTVDFNSPSPWCELRSTLHKDSVVAPSRIEGELTVAVKERFARADFPHGVDGCNVFAVRIEHLYSRLNDFTCCGVSDFACDLRHDVPCRTRSNRRQRL